MKNLVIGVSILIASFSLNATVLTYDVVYDGAGFTFDGGISWNNQSFNVGDSLDITLKADTGDHWEFLSTFSDLWYANVFDSGGCTQTGSWSWGLFNNGSSVLSSSGGLSQSCAHIGPQLAGGIDGALGVVFDEYKFNYTLSSGYDTTLFTSFNGVSYISGESLDLWSWTFNDGVNFEYVDANSTVAPVPEPSTLAIFLLGLLGLGIHRLHNGSKILAD